LRLWTALAIVWLALALAGAALLIVARRTHHTVPWMALFAFLAVPAILVPLLLAALRRAKNHARVANRIERRFPDLDARLLAALEQHPDATSNHLGFLQETVVRETLAHARRHRWESLVPATRFRAARWIHAVALAAFAIVFLSLTIEVSRHPLGGIAAL